MDDKQKLNLLEALSCLKAMCSSFDVCTRCPAYMGVCRIKYCDPEDYVLNTTTDEVWRAFR